MIFTAHQTPCFTHFYDDHDLYIPYALFGHHYPKNEPRASPKIQGIYSPEKTGIHPFSGKPLLFMLGEKGQYILADEDRVAHERSCPQCLPVWERLEASIASLEDQPDAMISATMDINTRFGPAELIIDAVDCQTPKGDPSAPVEFP